MLRIMCKAKIHCARVTGANLDYMGSITIDPVLMEAADIFPYEKVQVVNNNTGARFETYVIAGRRGLGEICLNGAAARLVQPDDIIIIMSYAMVDEEEVRTFKPAVVFVDENNGVVSIKKEEQ